RARLEPRVPRRYREANASLQCAPCGHDDEVGPLLAGGSDDLVGWATFPDDDARLRVPSPESVLEHPPLLAGEPPAFGGEPSDARRHHVRVGISDIRRLVNVEQDNFCAESAREARALVYGREGWRRKIGGCENPSNLHACSGRFPGDSRSLGRSNECNRRSV